MGYGPRGHKESDTTERLHFHFHLSHDDKTLMNRITGSREILSSFHQERTQHKGVNCELGSVSSSDHIGALILDFPVSQSCL